MIAHVGKYCLTTIGDEVAVTDMDKSIDLEDYSQYTVPPTKVEGLGKLIAKGVCVKLVTMGDGDMEAIYIIQQGHKWGYGYALNLTEPMFSEFGDTGIVCS